MLRKCLGQSAVVIVAACCGMAALQGCGSGFATNFLDVASSSASAKQAVSPTQLGYAWASADRTLRPIVGIVGSSRVAASVVSASTYTGAAFSPSSSFALLVRADGSLDRIALPAATISSVSGAAVPANARVRFSPSGAYAVIFAPGGTSVTSVSQVSTAPQVASLRASSAIIDVAISDKGTVLLLQKQGSGAQLAVLNQNGAMQSLGALGADASLAFVAKREDVLLADGDANTLTLARNVSTTPSMAQVATSGLLKTPIAVGAALDARWVVVANGAEQSVVRIDLTGATAPQTIACPSQPTTVEQLSGNANFRFSDIGRSPAWVADISSSTPTMLFVPAIAGI